MLVFLSTKLGNLYAESVQGRHIILMFYRAGSQLQVSTQSSHLKVYINKYPNYILTW